jgi:hypothetical protein
LITIQKLSNSSEINISDIANNDGSITIKASADKASLYKVITNGNVCDGSLSFKNYSQTKFDRESYN